MRPNAALREWFLARQRAGPHQGRMPKIVRSIWSAMMWATSDTFEKVHFFVTKTAKRIPLPTILRSIVGSGIRFAVFVTKKCTFSKVSEVAHIIADQILRTILGMRPWCGPARCLAKNHSRRAALGRIGPRPYQCQYGVRSRHFGYFENLVSEIFENYRCSWAVQKSTHKKSSLVLTSFKKI